MGYKKFKYSGCRVILASGAWWNDLLVFRGFGGRQWYAMYRDVRFK